eukprot:6466558-Amphidinium_carterae.1
MGIIGERSHESDNREKAQEDHELKRALELSVQIGTPREQQVQVDPTSAGSGTSAERREEEIANQQELSTALAMSAGELGADMRDSVKRSAEEIADEIPPTVAEAVELFENMATQETPKKFKSVAGVTDLRNEDATVDERDVTDDMTGEVVDESFAEGWFEEDELVEGLDPLAVWNGKESELQFIEDWDVFEVVERREDMQYEDTKWVLRVEPDYSIRARLVARQYKWKSYREDLFAPTSTAISNRIVDLIAVKKGYCTTTGDATRAFLQVPQDELCFVIPPPEWMKKWSKRGGGSNVCWKMKRWLYGQRKGPSAWTEYEAEVITDMKFMRDVACPHIFHCAETDVTIEVHADDIHGCGPREGLEAFWSAITRKLKFKNWQIHDVGASYEHLKRLRIRTEKGMWIRPNSERYIGKALALMNMEECKPVPTPMVSEVDVEDEVSDPELDNERAKRYRTVTCTLLYLSQDRCDVQYAVKELSRELAKPRESSERRMKRVLRYLAGTKEMAIYFPAVGGRQALCWSDSNWAGCRKTRKSTSGGMLQIGGCLVYSWSRTQSVIAQSSGEAEWYAIAGATADALFVQGLLERLSFPVHFELRTDSSAARAIGLRLGTGRLRSLQVKTLWCQSVFRAQAIVLSKCKGTQNVADLATKAYSKQTLEALMGMTGMRIHRVTQ